MWNTRAVQRALEAAVIVGLALFVIAIGAIALIAKAAPVEIAAQPEVLIVQHGYDGTTEQAGTLIRWQYTGGRMLVEWSDTTTDGVFRNGFE